jgi:hypothetical protein
MLFPKVASERIDCWNVCRAIAHGSRMRNKQAPHVAVVVTSTTLFVPFAQILEQKPFAREIVWVNTI